MSFQYVLGFINYFKLYKYLYCPLKFSAVYDPQTDITHHTYLFRSPKSASDRVFESGQDIKVNFLSHFILYKTKGFLKLTTSSEFLWQQYVCLKT